MNEQMNHSDILKVIADTTNFTQFDDQQVAFYNQVCKSINPLLLANMLSIAYNAGRRDAHQVSINEDSERLRQQQSIIEVQIAFARRES